MIGWDIRGDVQGIPHGFKGFGSFIGSIDDFAASIIAGFPSSRVVGNHAFRADEPLVDGWSINQEGFNGRTRRSSRIEDVVVLIGIKITTTDKAENLTGA